MIAIVLPQVFYISGAFGLTMRGILIDMKDGYAMVPGSDDLEYGHNTDGFDVSGSTLVYVHCLYPTDIKLKPPVIPVR
jgi:hypothetical protein